MTCWLRFGAFSEPLDEAEVEAIKQKLLDVGMSPTEAHLYYHHQQEIHHGPASVSSAIYYPQQGAGRSEQQREAIEAPKISAYDEILRTLGADVAETARRTRRGTADSSDQ